MHERESSAGDRRFAFAVRSTGTRNRFADAGEMLRFTTEWFTSGCETVIEHVRRSAAGGMTTVKSPAEITPPRRPTVLVVLAEVTAVAPRGWVDPLAERVPDSS